MKLLYTIIGMLVFLFAITFSLKNTVPVPLKYYDVLDVNIPSYLLIFVSFGVGVIFAGFLDIVERLRLKRKVSKLTRKVKALEKTQKEAIEESEGVEVLPPESDDMTTM
jgi:uncharacterized integral membrane protein